MTRIRRLGELGGVGYVLADGRGEWEDEGGVDDTNCDREERRIVKYTWNECVGAELMDIDVM